MPRSTKKTRRPNGRRTTKVTTSARRLERATATEGGTGQATPDFKAGKDL